MLTTAPHHLNVFSLFGIIGFTFTKFIIFKEIWICPSPPETLDPRGAPVEALLAELVHCICGHYSLDLQSVLSFRLGCEIKILQLLYTIILLLDKSQLNVSFYYIVHWMHLRYLHQSLFLKWTEVRWSSRRHVQGSALMLGSVGLAISVGLET